MFRPSIQPRSLSPWRKPARRGAAEETDWGDSNPIRLTGPVGWAIPVRGPKMAPPPSSAMTSRRLVCRERSIVRGDGGPFTPPPPSRLEARSRLSQHSCSFDHLVGARKEAWRDCKADRLGGPEIDDQLEDRRLLDWHVGRRGSAQYAGDEIGRPTPKLVEPCPIRYEAAVSHHIGHLADG